MLFKFMAYFNSDCSPVPGANQVSKVVAFMGLPFRGYDCCELQSFSDKKDKKKKKKKEKERMSTLQLLCERLVGNATFFWFKAYQG